MIKIKTDRKKLWAALVNCGILCGLALALATPRLWAADQTLQVNVGEAVILPSDQVAKLAVADPAVADVISLSATELSVIGKAPGITTLTVVHEAGKATKMYRVEVVPGSGVRSIHEAIGAPGISVREIGDSIILEGRVENEQQADRAARVAAAYKGNVVNLIEVSNPRQVRIGMRLVEVSTDASKKLGIDYFGTDGSVTYGFAFGGAGSSLASIPHAFIKPGTTELESSDDGEISGLGVVQAQLNLLLSKGAARILSQPSLVTMSGKEASFLAGGEVPIVNKLDNSFNVEFKEFGVRMTVKPVVDSVNNIQTRILAEVSSVDPVARVEGQPSFLTRRAETDVQVRDGQTIVIGGLLSNQHDHDIRKVPWLGDIPVLGLLFRSKVYNAGLSELLVFVTPELVKDIDGDAATAGRTPAMKDWHGNQADEQLDTQQQDPFSEWQKPLEVGEFKPLIRPSQPVSEAAPDTDASLEPAPAAAPTANFTTR